MKIQNKFVTHWVPVILVFAVLVFLTLQPVPSALFRLYYRADKLTHFVIYSVMGFFLLRAFMTVFPDMHVLYVSVPSAFFSAFLGVLAEALQYFVPDRIVDLSDIFANLKGSCMGIMLYVSYCFFKFIRGKTN